MMTMWFKRPSKSPPKNPPEAVEPPLREDLAGIRLPKLSGSGVVEGVSNIYNTPNMLRFPKRRRSGHHRSRR